jgi:hypothetical protein
MSCISKYSNTHMSSYATFNRMPADKQAYKQSHC